MAQDSLIGICIIEQAQSLRSHTAMYRLTSTHGRGLQAQVPCSEVMRLKPLASRNLTSNSEVLVVLR